MEKTATLNLRVNPAVKEQAEFVLTKLGMPMSTAINIYLKQIALVGGIPFPVGLSPVPDSMNADLMTDEELSRELEEGYQDAIAGRVHDAKAAFAELRGRYKL